MKILWDLDGTIVDTWPTLVEAFTVVAKKDLPYEEVLPHLKYGTAYDFYRVDKNKVTEFREIERTLPNDRKPLFPYVKDVLSASDANVLVTHRNRRSTEELLEHWNLGQFFEEVICPADDGYSLKPDIHAYKYLHDRYGLDLAVGDQSTDLIPARKIGIKTCSFREANEYADETIYCYSEFPYK
ncbi:HAD-IA family hydrolase [Bacillus sp. ISL-37]|uniref:HAD family hydrolase n=1 Tax=Bacillus sp. ISL-37 TaxID=2819123 RepID=UPI001BEABFF7|nr:HAD-IA family hydrolase [Bacillus sp. ISL-37]MBT2685346.1 HAD-IA family hydrolase [Bacillus sp. ISL-37]